jgi:lysozyme
MLTDKQIFDAIRERRGKSLTQAEVDSVNAVLYPDGQPDTRTWDREKLEAELTLDEGKRLKAYRDTKGKWTIGIGHNLTDCGTAPLTRTLQDVLANGINEAENDILFDHDINHTESDLDKYAAWWRTLDPVRQRVMLNMCFNMGWGAGTTHGLHTFVNTLGMIQRGEYSRAADAMLASLWAREVGMRAQRLANMMRDGRP